MTRRLLVLALAWLATSAIPAARAADFTVDVDAREAPRRLLHVAQGFVAKPGAMGLSYPKWIPGEHGPTGPNTDVAGLVIRAAGHALEWRRDPVDMNTVRFEMPAGAARVGGTFDFLLRGPPHGFTPAAGPTEKPLLLSCDPGLVDPAG